MKPSMYVFIGHRSILFLLTSSVLFLSSCRPNSFHVSNGDPEINRKLEGIPGPSPSPTEPSPVDGGSGSKDEESSNEIPPVVVGPSLKICSNLNFKGVQWPATLSVEERNYLALGLSVSGSFEGRKGWANLANNFDGMGISLGILQQNLGTGSLQPILLEVLPLIYSGKVPFDDDEKLKSLSVMVNQWRLDKNNSTNQSEASGLFFNDYDVISELDSSDDPSGDISEFAISYSVNRGFGIINKKSVDWALRELYLDGGKTFRSDWSAELNQMAQHPEYVSLQLKHALSIYNKALSYFKSFKLTDTKSYLLMFDFVVQNGGFKKKVLKDYNSYLAKNPKASESQKNLKILELRLVDVLPQYREDVRSRKMAIINSQGTVHGAKRDLTKEYCFQSGEIIITKP